MTQLQPLRTLAPSRSSAAAMSLRSFCPRQVEASCFLRLLPLQQRTHSHTHTQPQPVRHVASNQRPRARRRLPEWSRVWHHPGQPETTEG